MKGLYTALKCFMLEFWDLNQYAPTWNTTTLDYLDRLPRNAEARCIHLPESTRICQLKVSEQPLPAACHVAAVSAGGHTTVVTVSVTCQTCCKMTTALFTTALQL